MVKIKCRLKKMVLFAFLLTLSACPEEGPEYDGSLTMSNQSDEEIIWLGMYGSSIEEKAKHPWLNPEKRVILKHNFVVEPFNVFAVKHALNKYGFTKYYLFNYDSVKTIPWERIRDERIILKEVTFHSWEEMEACDFTITYP
jgi:hypothetical protein